MQQVLHCLLPEIDFAIEQCKLRGKRLPGYNGFIQFHPFVYCIRRRFIYLKCSIPGDEEERKGKFFAGFHKSHKRFLEHFKVHTKFLFIKPFDLYAPIHKKKLIWHLSVEFNFQSLLMTIQDWKVPKVAIVSFHQKEVQIFRYPHQLNAGFEIFERCNTELIIKLRTDSLISNFTECSVLRLVTW